MSDENNGQVAKVEPAFVPSAIERVIVQGDLAAMSEVDRTRYFMAVCESLGVNHLTRPFAYISFKGKLFLQPLKGCYEQLRRRDNVSLAVTNRQFINGTYVVSVRATLPTGRIDEADGVVWVEGLKGDDLANRMLVAETKGKNRVTASICGLGLAETGESDEPHVVGMDHQPREAITGKIADQPKSEAFKELGTKLEAAKSPEDVAAVGKELNARKGELGTGEFEALVGMGTIRRKEVTHKSPAATVG